MCVCVWLKIQVKMTFCLWHSRHLRTHLSFFYSNNTFIPIKKFAAHTRNQCDKNTVKWTWYFVNTHARKLHTCQFTQNDETYSWVAGFIRFFHALKFHIGFHCRSNIRALFIEKKGGGEIRWFLRFESNFIDSVSIWWWDGWMNKNSSICVDSPINLPDVCHICRMTWLTNNNTNKKTRKTTAKATTTMTIVTNISTHWGNFHNLYINREWIAQRTLTTMKKHLNKITRRPLTTWIRKNWITVKSGIVNNVGEL